MTVFGPSAALRLLPFPWRTATRRHRPWHDFVLDPGGDLVLLWHRVFLVACLVALFLDPFFFYLLYIGNAGCMAVDYSIGIPVTVFRTIADLFYLVHMLLKFRIAFVAPSSRVFGRGELVTDHRQIAMRYLKKDFVIDLVATLPIPQFIIWCLIPAVSSSPANHTNHVLTLLVILQYFPRLFLIFPLNARIVKANGVVARTAFAGAVYNLLLYVLASHGLGALWYVMSMERQNYCWVTECDKESGRMNTPLCKQRYLDCRSFNQPDRKTWLNTTKVIENCDASNSSGTFDFGFFADALTEEVVAAPFFEKYLYCLWWGLRNLSSYGQNLTTSTNVDETLFAMFISILGLVLFAQLIGNMQTYLQSLSVKIEEWRVKRRDIEEWMRHRQLPEDLQERVRRFFQYKWLATRGPIFLANG